MGSIVHDAVLVEGTGEVIVGGKPLGHETVVKDYASGSLGKVGTRTTGGPSDVAAASTFPTDVSMKDVDSNTKRPTVDSVSQHNSSTSGPTSSQVSAEQGQQSAKTEASTEQSWQVYRRRRHAFVPPKAIKEKYGSMAQALQSSSSALSEISNNFHPQVVESTQDELAESPEPNEFPLDTEASDLSRLKGAVMHEEYYFISVEHPAENVDKERGVTDAFMRAKVCTFLSGVNHFVNQANECIFLLEYEGDSPTYIIRALDLPDFGKGFEEYISGLRYVPKQGRINFHIRVRTSIRLGTLKNWNSSFEGRAKKVFFRFLGGEWVFLPISASGIS